MPHSLPLRYVEYCCHVIQLSTVLLQTGCEEGLEGAKYHTMEWTEIAKAVEENWEPLPSIETAPINKFLLDNGITVKKNP